MNGSEPLILIVDDELQTRKFVGMNLKARGYRVLEAADGTEALKMFDERPVSLIMLDVLMPGPNGFEVCERIRQTSEVPIIMLTAKATESDIVEAFGRGADDYLTKPFGVGEMLARVRAALRRSEIESGHSSPPTLFGDTIVDFAARRVWRNGEQIDLTPTELALLSLLVRNAERVLTHRFILEAVWGSAYSEEKEYVRAYIYRLRQKIEESADEPRHILGVSGVGYMFTAGTESQPGGADSDLVRASGL